MKLIISNIDWDKSENKEADLPTEVIVDDPMMVPHLLEGINEDAENVAEYLSNRYGYCVCGFTTCVEGVGVK